MKVKKICLWHLFAALLVGSFLWPVTESYWSRLDETFYRFLNHSLDDHPWWQIFWAMASNKLADWLEDLCILGFYIVHISKTRKELRLKKVSELVFCLFYIALIIYFVNRVLFRSNWHIYRDSPTLALDGGVRLTDEVPWISFKDSSNKSFPADHATTAILFAVSYFYLAGWRLGLIAAFYATFLCIPRLITGAHWLSDVLVGSVPIVIIFLSWLFCTPLLHFCSQKIEKFFLHCFAIKNKWSIHREKGGTVYGNCKSDRSDL